MIITTLTGTHVKLEPLAEEHREGLRSAADDERIWTTTLTVSMGPEFDRWFDRVLTLPSAGKQFPFAVRQMSDGVLIGSTSFLDPDEFHQRVEIGSTWYHPSVWSTAVNPECKLLLMTYAFEEWNALRVAYCTDLLNLRSQVAIAKLGAVRDGVLRSHMNTQGNRRRDTVVFSIVSTEWPEVKSRLQARVATFAPTSSLI